MPYRLKMSKIQSICEHSGVVMLAAKGYITGQTININGGRYMS